MNEQDHGAEEPKTKLKYRQQLSWAMASGFVVIVVVVIDFSKELNNFELLPSLHILTKSIFNGGPL